MIYKWVVTIYPLNVYDIFVKTLCTFYIQGKNVKIYEFNICFGYFVKHVLYIVKYIHTVCNDDMVFSVRNVTEKVFTEFSEMIIPNTY